MELLLSDSRFLVVPETMADALIVTDSVGTIHYANPACEALFQLVRDEIVGKSVATLLAPPCGEECVAYLAQPRSPDAQRVTGFGRDLVGVKSDGAAFPIYMSIGEALMPSGWVFVGIIYDLTQKKRAEEVLLHHQKLQTIGQLSGGIAHDFNNILSVINGNLEIVEGLDIPEAAHRAIKRAKSAATRAARITQRLLTLARKQRGNSQPIDLNAVIEEMAETLQRVIGEAIEIRLELQPDLGVIDLDVDQFEAAILNLAVNSRDAMPEGGILTIKTASVRPGPSSPDGEESSGEYVGVTVSDTGVGMSPGVRAQAFDPFFTTKEVGAGTGLGLPTVYGFMKQIGGHAHIESEVARGTAVSLLFPRGQTEKMSQTRLTEGPTPMGRGETILAVEDDPDVLLVSVSRLESLGYHVLAAADGEHALHAVRSNKGVIRLALIDVVIPGGMDGYALADRIEQEAGDVRIVMTSGYSPRAMKDGASGRRPFLAKPTTRSKLAQTIRRILDAPS